jgi:DNA-binding NarL/FixJ family response regulator
MLSDPQDPPVAALTVMIVDDSEVFLRTVAEAVVAAGLAIVATASSGEEALRLQEAHRPDAVLLDVRLPDSNGHDIAEQIRTGFPDTQVVLMSVSEPRDERVVSKWSLTPEGVRQAFQVA